MSLNIEYRPLDDLAPYEKNPRKHGKDQVSQIARSLARFGWATPLGVADGRLIYGHARRLAALDLRKRRVPIPHHADPDLAPVVDLSHLSAEERRAYVIADNQLAANAGWDHELLGIELRELAGAQFDLSLLGFDNLDLTKLMRVEPVEDEAGALLELADITIPEPRHPVRPGDHWKLADRHDLLCRSVIEDWGVWQKLLRPGALFIPYPGPFVPFGERIDQYILVMVQPDAYAAGVILDRFAEVHGEASVVRLK